MTHTPGPWKAHRAIWDKETWDVAYILEGVKEARAADSYLIAAAPDMLKMLLELQECAEYWSEYDVPLGIVGRLNETIRKARGEV